MKTCKAALEDILDINCDTSYDKAKTIIKDKYNLDLSRSNYDKIKSVRRKNKKGKKTKNMPIPPQNSIGKGETASPIHTINNTLASMEDIELIRHLCRQFAATDGMDPRIRLDAVKKLLELKDKSGTINIEEQDEKEVIEQFRQQSTNNLVSILKKSSLKGH